MSYSQPKGNKPIGVSQFPQIHRQPQQSLRSQVPQAPHRSEDRNPTTHRQQVFHQPPRHPSPVPAPSQGIIAARATPSPSSSPGVANPHGGGPANNVQQGVAVNTQQQQQGLGTAFTHDNMSKQGGIATRPGLPSSPHQQGNVLQQQQQQQQQVVYTVVQQQQQRQPTQQQPPVFMHRVPTANPRALQLQQAPPQASSQQMAPPPSGPMNTLNHSAYIPQQFSLVPMNVQSQINMQYSPRDAIFPAQFASQSAAQQFQPSQRSVYQQHHQQQQQQQQQYTAQPQQAQLYNQPPGQTYYNSSPPVSLPQQATFFPGSQNLGMTQAQLRQPVYQLPQQAKYTSQQPKRFIEIRDPNTNEDVTDKIMAGSSASHSGHSSASATPPNQSQTPPQNVQANEEKAAIQATFAAQVARLAHDDPVTMPADEPAVIAGSEGSSLLTQPAAAAPTPPESLAGQPAAAAANQPLLASVPVVEPAAPVPSQTGMSHGIIAPGVGGPGVTAPEGAASEVVASGVASSGVAAPGVVASGVASSGVAAPGVGGSGVADPEVAAPGVVAPGVAVPGVAVPGVAVPGVVVPGVAVPGVAVPGVAAPGVAAPEVAASQVATPEVAAPEVAVPGAAAAEMAAPGGATSGVAALEVAAPEVAASGLAAPEVAAPGVSAPQALATAALAATATPQPTIQEPLSSAEATRSDASPGAASDLGAATATLTQLEASVPTTAAATAAECRTDTPPPLQQGVPAPAAEHEPTSVPTVESEKRPSEIADQLGASTPSGGSSLCIEAEDAPVQESVSSSSPASQVGEEAAVESNTSSSLEDSAKTEASHAAAKDPSKKRSQKNRLKDIEKKAPKDEDEFEAYRLEPSERSDSPEDTEIEEVGTAEVVDDAAQPATTAPVVIVAAETAELTASPPETSSPRPASPDEAATVSVEGGLTDETEPKEVAIADEMEREVEAGNPGNQDEVEETVNEDTKPSLKDNKMQLKYTYREDQWSPMNPSGKKQYDRNFLLQFQPDCKDKPEGLPHIPDIVLDQADIRAPSLEPVGSRQSNNLGRGGSDFMPGYMKSPRPMQSQPNFGQGAGKRSSKEPKKVIQRVAHAAVKLQTAGDKAWKPDKDKPTDEEESKTYDLMKKMKSLLNKLTPDNLQTLKEKALALPVDTEERLKGIIDLVFEKAVTESAFSRTYADLCKDLSQLKVTASSGTGMVQFRTLLINRCQKEFEKEKSDDAEDKKAREAIKALPLEQRGVAYEDLELKLIKNKRRMLGNIRFIGELFKLQMLIEHIMHDCIFTLMCSKDEESLECMAQMMSTIGKMLDHEKAKNRMDQYFDQIRAIINQPKGSTRIKFMLQDVLDLRQRRWVPRRVNDNPKTIDEIHKDYRQEEERKKMDSFQASMAPPISRTSRGKREQQPQRVGPPQTDIWSTVTSTKATRVAVDPNKFRVTKQQSIGDDVQLGPSRQSGGWSRGSSWGSSKTQQQQTQQQQQQPSNETQEARQSNRFQMLSDDKRARGPVSDMKGRGSQGMHGKRSSSSRERDERSRERRSVIADVQRFSGPRRSNSREKEWEADSRRGKPEPPNSTREPPKPAAVQPPPAAREPPKPAPPHLSEEKFEKDAKATIMEYFNLRDLKEAMLCISEMKSPSLMHIFVRTAMFAAVEDKPASREATGLLFYELLRSGQLSRDRLVDGLKEVMDFAQDMALDIPSMWTYTGEIIGYIFRDGSLPLSILSGVLEPAHSAGTAADVIAEVLKASVKITGASLAAKLWHSSGFTWSMFLPSPKDVKEFVNSKNLEFTLSSGSSGDMNASNMEALSDDEWVATIKRCLGDILGPVSNVNDTVFDWVKANLTIASNQRLFVRALVTAVVQSTVQGEGESCRLDHQRLTDRTAILKRYIRSDNDLELQALYAVQALNQYLQNPPSLLGVIFNILYDEDVIPEETFYSWQKSEEPIESLGRGVALKSVTSFFDWLREADDEPAK